MKNLPTDTLDKRGFPLCECGHLVVTDHSPYSGVCLECSGCHRRDRLEELGRRKRVIQITIDANV